MLAEDGAAILVSCLTFWMRLLLTRFGFSPSIVRANFVPICPYAADESAFSCSLSSPLMLFDCWRFTPVFWVGVRGEDVRVRLSAVPPLIDDDDETDDGNMSMPSGDVDELFGLVGFVLLVRALNMFDDDEDVASVVGVVAVDVVAA